MAGAAEAARERGAGRSAALVVAAGAGGPVDHGVAGAPQAPSRWVRFRPPRIAQALTVLALAVHAAIWGVAAPFGRSVAAGATLLALGLGWMIWAWARFRTAGTPIPPTARPRRLVDDGPFAVGRNPMYLGIVVAMLGLAVLLGVPTLAAAALAFALVVQRVHIPFEEARLREAFGGWYSDYAAAVRRWL